MAGEDQERFEDYLELERYIEALQQGHVAHPPKDLTPDQARVYRMAALFRSASPEAAEPHPEFAQALHERLLALDKDAQDEETQPRLKSMPLPGQQVALPEQEATQQELPPPVSDAPQKAVPAPEASQKAAPRRARFVSRRNLISGGAVAAASIAVGFGAGRLSEPGQPAANGNGLPPGPTSTPTYTAKSFPYLNPTGSTELHFVTMVSKLGDDMVSFTAGAITGFVTRNDGDDANDPDKGNIMAMSATCTHMGCTISWLPKERMFVCPCHGGMFTEYGQPANSGPLHYLVPLPRLKVTIIDDKIYVEVPKNTP